MAKDPDMPRRAVPAKCVACERLLESPLFCGGCQRLYPADGLNFFELLGLQADYDLDPEEVRRKYFAVVREIHPDRMAAAGAELQRLSMRINAQINQAFRVLLDPVQRAEYLLELAGGTVGADDKQVPQAVLMETLMLREEIEEAKAVAEPARLEGLRARVQSRFESTLEQAAELARELPGTAETRRELRGKLNALRYYRKLVELV